MVQPSSRRQDHLYGVHPTPEPLADTVESPPELLKIGDFARLAGTNLRTLRYYEELGLLSPAKRSKGGFRYYRDTDLNRLNMIRDLQALGLQLERIRELMNTRSELGDRERFLGRVQQALLEQDRLLQERMQDLQQQRDKIELAVTKLDACHSCSHTPGPGNNHCEPCCLTGIKLPDEVSALF